MKPAPFEYLAPDSLDEALAALSTYGDRSKLLAGGQSLVPMLAFRIVRPAALIDLGRVPGLTGIRYDGQSVSIGAMTTHRAIELESRLTGRYAMMREALALVGHVAIRNAGTMGGSMAHADPAAEWPALALAMDATFRVAGPAGERSIAAGEFFTGWMSTALLPSEILVGMDFALPRAGTGSAFLEVARRHGDFALAGVAAVIGLEDGLVSHARLTLLGVGLSTVRAIEAEQLLLGREPTSASFGAAAAAVDADIRPLADQHGSVDYKRHLSRVLTERVLRAAHERIMEEAA